MTAISIYYWQRQQRQQHLSLSEVSSRYRTSSFVIRYSGYLTEVADFIAILLHLLNVCHCLTIARGFATKCNVGLWQRWRRILTYFEKSNEERWGNIDSNCISSRHQDDWREEIKGAQWLSIADKDRAIGDWVQGSTVAGGGGLLC